MVCSYALVRRLRDAEVIPNVGKDLVAALHAFEISASTHDCRRSGHTVTRWLAAGFCEEAEGARGSEPKARDRFTTQLRTSRRSRTLAATSRPFREASGGRGNYAQSVASLSERPAWWIGQVVVNDFSPSSA